MQRLLALVCAFAFACTGDDPVVRPPEEVPPPPVLPTLDITQPARGAFFPAGPVAVVGRAIAGDAPIASMLLNDAALAVNGEGYFEGSVEAPHGIVVLGVRATDADGERVVDGRSVHLGPVHPPATRLERAIGIQLGAAFLDDDQRDVDDVAGLVQAVIEDPGFGSLAAGAPLTTSGLTITINSLTVQQAAVDIVPLTGIMQSDLNLWDVEGTFTVDGFGFTTDGWFAMDEVEILLDVDASVIGGSVVVDVPFAEATIDGFDWGADGFPDWLSGLLTDTLAATLETRLEESSKELVGEMLGTLIDAFAVDLRLGEQEQVRVVTKLVSVEAVPQGLIGWMDAQVEATQWGIAPPIGAGSLRTPGTAPTLPRVGGSSFLAVIDDDLVNQAMFALWGGGLLSGIGMSGAELVASSGEDLPPPLGPVSQLDMSVNLPPVMRPSAGDWPLRVGLGELVLDITRTDGERITASVNLDVQGELSAGPAGLGLSLDNRPAHITLHVGMLAAPPALDPGDLASLFRLATPSLIGRSSSLFPGFPLPEVALQELVDVQSLRGVTWGASELQTEVQPDGWLVMQGRIGPLP